MKKSAHLILILSSILLASGCATPAPLPVAVDTLCISVTRFHTSDAQRAAAHADPGTWFSLFQYLATVDGVLDDKCKGK